jgi:iron complex transport system substrate-binding protein
MRDVRKHAMRIVSLIASATEIVCALGFEDALVGRSHECDFPESVKRLPVLTAPKLDVSAPSREIDARVKSLVEDALSVYRVDAEKLRALAPDVIVTQTQCEVCAVSERDVVAALEGWTGARPVVVSCLPNALADVWEDMARVAAALGAPERGRELARRSRERMDAVAARVRDEPRARVACIEWIDPLMSAGNWVPELCELARAECLFGEAGKHSPWMTIEELAAKDPDAIAVLPCGFDIERTRREMPALVGRPEWPRLRAVREGRVFLCDGNQYFNRPGPRLVESLEILAEVLHPRVVHFGREGEGWVRYS